MLLLWADGMKAVDSYSLSLSRDKASMRSGLKEKAVLLCNRTTCYLDLEREDGWMERLRRASKQLPLRIAPRRSDGFLLFVLAAIMYSE
jgi:hypothetical protein